MIQTAVGWTDSHLHQFGCGPRYYDPLTEYYLCPYMAEDGDQPGVPEDQVQLDELLVDPGDTLFYCYDFGDDWQHTIILEAVLPHTPDMPPAVCLDGDRPGPPEDCGGIEGYETVRRRKQPCRSTACHRARCIPLDVRRGRRPVEPSPDPVPARPASPHPP